MTDLRRKNFRILKHILVKLHEAPHIVGQQYGVPQGILHVFIIILYENLFQEVSVFLPSNLL
jgi:hypothetical protein